MKRLTLGMVALTLLGNGVREAKADFIIFNDYGPAYTYTVSAGLSVGGATSGNTLISPANEFTASLTAAVTEIDLGISLISGTNSVIANLMTDNSGTPGTVLESYSFVGQMGILGTQNAPLVATSLINPTLVAGTNYWMVVVAGASDTSAAWNLNDQGVAGIGAYSVDGGSTWSGTDFGPQAFGAFEVFGGQVAVPEPSSLFMMWTLALTTIGVGGFRKWLKRTTAA